MPESKKELHLSPQSISNISYSTPNSPALNPPKEFSTNSHASSSSAPISSILDTINFAEVDQISNLQNKCLDNTVTLIKSLEQFNNLSQTKLNELNKKFETNTLLIHDLKFELEGIFKRINSIKLKLSKKYPAEYEQSVETCKEYEVEDDY
ncbi:hypothetical protein CONCODRAFT_77143 [Conidiobolus coronatus NRRL 28638]|uniref:KxDL domain-containing protein n=1 Tax=Conidiobolus coronatus (strain ATCC 28846 / CBS 209.66 / NRRL 28638) TaxID=796925 RepID=A0A137PFV0_CONC2|nr:hypothetical protein CONCODRAFT_77143 [Conidiobolus coronatus NRRL 28638]|eukprot:KXN73886.1 hypothetical protein CONCODRAFT_77143 [Conidiobolus coronatus NRRL 28638]